jgi:hypothetical protein
MGFARGLYCLVMYVLVLPGVGYVDTLPRPQVMISERLKQKQEKASL